MVMIPVHTRDTAGTGRGMSRVAKSPTRTRTRDTRDPKPAGFPVPVTNPNDRCRDGTAAEEESEAGTT
jgi:hypothetical protein